MSWRASHSFPIGLLVCGPLLVGCSKPTPSQPSETPPAPVVAHSSVDKAVATTGDILTYRVTVERDPEVQVELPEPGADIAGFRVIDLGRETSELRGGRIKEVRWFKLRADLVGSYILPPVALSYSLEVDSDSEPSEPKTLETSPIFVEVESVLPADGEVTDIRDLKQLSRVEGPPLWHKLALAALLLGVIAAVVVLLRRRARRPVVVPAVPPHELAFAELDRLRGTDFEDPEAVRRYYFRVSEVVRTYVEGRFKLNATDLTSEEILPELGGLHGLSATDASTLERFLLATDRVKFAGELPGEEGVRESYELALGFVEATRERPVEPQSEAVAA